MENPIIKSKLLLLLITIVMAPQALTQSLQYKNPQLLTEKTNYSSDETVNIRGENFRSFERVRLSVTYDDEYLKQTLLLGQWDVYADKAGSFATDWRIWEIYPGGTRYTITARGSAKSMTATRVSTFAPAAPAVKIEQCANSNASPQNLDCPPSGNSGWVTGIVGSSKARYFEGNSIAYRNVMTDLTVGHSYKWTVKYDTSKGGDNAIDYLTTFNRTITNANPCREGANLTAYCTVGSPSDTFAIPTDPNVTNGRDQINGTSDDITQIAGNITAWGADITAVSNPTYTGTFPGGDSTASVDITFTATSSTVVLAWGGHISTRADWGELNGSVNISGAAYHTSNGGLMNLTASTTCCGGSQDLQLQAAAVARAATIIIRKNASPPTNSPFGFTTTNLTPTNFTLTDNSSTTDPSFTFSDITTFNVKSIEETTTNGYDLTAINCTVDVGTGGTPAPVRVGNRIDIDIKEGDQVTCTFVNDFVTAADVTVSGRVFSSNGYGLYGAVVSMTDANGNVRTARTNPFGYFRFYEVEAGESYFFEVRHKGYVFTPQFVDVGDQIDGLNFYPSQ